MLLCWYFLKLSLSFSLYNWYTFGFQSMILRLISVMFVETLLWFMYNWIKNWRCGKHLRLRHYLYNVNATWTIAMARFEMMALQHCLVFINIIGGYLIKLKPIQLSPSLVYLETDDLRYFITIGKLNQSIGACCILTLWYHLFFFFLYTIITKLIELI